MIDMSDTFRPTSTLLQPTAAFLSSVQAVNEKHHANESPARPHHILPPSDSLLRPTIASIHAMNDKLQHEEEKHKPINVKPPSESLLRPTMANYYASKSLTGIK